MAITKDTTVDQITVLANGVVLYRMATSIGEDGTTISETYHRCSLSPGQDIASAPERVQAICGAAWTPEVLEAFQSIQKPGA